MSEVPVVSATLTTRTVHECRTLSEPPRWFPADDEAYAIVSANLPSHARERLTVDPVFVVVDAAPDLTCRDCGGMGSTADQLADGADVAPYGRCPSCGGTGVSPVYAATWQCRGVENAHQPGGGWVPAAECEWEGPDDDRHERRQVIQWRATDVTVLPVVGDDFSAERMARTVENRLCPEDAVPRIAKRWGDWLMWTGSEPTSIGERIGDEPWAADLRPGQFVVRLSGWEHLDTPHTRMVIPDDYTQPLHDAMGGTVPLSVPDGAVTWIELAETKEQP